MMVLLSVGLHGGAWTGPVKSAVQLDLVAAFTRAFLTSQAQPLLALKRSGQLYAVTRLGQSAGLCQSEAHAALAHALG